MAFLLPHLNIWWCLQLSGCLLVANRKGDSELATLGALVQLLAAGLPSQLALACHQSVHLRPFFNSG